MFASSHSISQPLNPMQSLPPLHLGDSTSQAPARATGALRLQASDTVSGIDMVRSLLDAGWDNEARMLLRQLTVLTPGDVSPWLQLLALDPDIVGDREFVAGFVQHHPEHHFAQVMRDHLDNMSRTPVLIEPRVTFVPSSPTDGPPRLGDYLISRGWITTQHVDQALTLQKRLRQYKIDQRLGTVLLMRGTVTTPQLAVALAPSLTTNSDELGNYLVRRGVLGAADVAKALAYQSEITAVHDRRYLQELEGYRSLREKQRSPNLPPPQRQLPPRIGEILVGMGMLDSDEIARILFERQQKVQ